MKLDTIRKASETPVTNSLPESTSTADSKQKSTKEYTAAKQSKSTAVKKSKAETIFDRALEFQQLKSQLKKLAAERDSVRQTLLL